MLPLAEWFNNRRLPNAEDYKVFYQSYEKVDDFSIDNLILLFKPLEHRIIFSNNVQIEKFDLKIQYPFFYTDVVNNRIYFVEPKPQDTVHSFLPDATRTVLHLPFNRSVISRGRFFNTDSAIPDESGNLRMFSVKSGLGVSQDSGLQQERGISPFFGVTGLRQPQNLLSFYTFYHPFASIFIKKINEGGVRMLLLADTAELPNAINEVIDDNPDVLANDKGKTFDTYDPNFTYIKKYDPLDDERNYYLQNVDFSKYGTYSLYNWELFFHAPFMIATRLSSNGKYSDARKWFHYIFDPTSAEAVIGSNANSPFWGVLPFKRPIEDAIKIMLDDLQKGTGSQADFDKVVNEWREDPFNAFAIARNRIVAFMKNAVMRYLDNLIAWGDDLFMTYRRENINEATQLYILALHVLGDKPQYVPTRGNIQPYSYDTLKSSATGINSLGDALVQYQNAFPNSGSVGIVDNSIPQSLLGIGKALYFCIPPNDQLLNYWTKIGDRLFKIRHGQNIDGIVKPLALYEPPIDPALLLRAKAEGLDIGSILADLESPAPLYRFSYLLQKAKEFSNEVVSLGNALLSANEKQDAEALSRLRQTQEIEILTMVSEVKKRQVLEAQANLDTLTSGRLTARQKLQHYANQLLGKDESEIPAAPVLTDTLSERSSLPGETVVNPVTSSIDVSLVRTEESGVKVIPKEMQEMAFNRAAEIVSYAANSAEVLAGILHMFPGLFVNLKPFGVGSHTKITSGEQIGMAIAAGARALAGQANLLSAEAASAARMASYIRRQQDWVFQANMTAREIVQLDKQIIAAQIRHQMAAHELANHIQQTDNSKAVEQFFIGKFSNEELYQWMNDRLQHVCKEGYQLAYNMARKAEKAYRFELGIPDSSFIQYGYFQDSFLGITAGEQLSLALKQLESSFLERNVRELELTKHISLLMLDPAALLQLIETGSCTFRIPEEWLDMDYPGHYFRRIKSVSISIPCVAGPYTTISSTLRLTNNSIRIDGDVSKPYTDPSHFFATNVPFTSIATSSAQGDSGTFELSFHDERYLPFEGAGAISQWTLELNGKYKGGTIDLSQFDYSTISDILVHIRFTAREDVTKLRDASILNLQAYKKTSSFRRMISARHDMPDEFYQFINTPLATGDQVLKLKLDQVRFPYFASRDTISIDSIEIFADAEPLAALEFTLKPVPAATPTTLAQAGFGLMWNAKAIFPAALKVDATNDVVVEITRSKGVALKKDNFKDLFVVVHFKLI